MSRVGGLFVALSKDWLRSREAVFFSFAFPVVLLVIFSTVFAGGSAQFTVYVQNDDVAADGEPTELSAALVDALDGVDALTVRSLAPGRNVTEWSRENETSATKRVVVVPDGFAAAVRNGSLRARRAVIGDTLNRSAGRLNDTELAALREGLGRAGLLGDRSSAGDASDAENATGSNTETATAAQVRFLSASDDGAAPAVRGIVASVVAGFNDRAVGVEEPPVTVGTGPLSSRDLAAADYFLPALIGAVVLLNGVVTVTTIVATFNNDGTLKRLAATPVRKRDWIAANVALQAVLALVITGVMVLVARLLFGVTVVPGPLALALVLVGAVGFTAAGMALGSVLDDPDAATSLGNAVALPMMFLSGVFWQIELMPEFLQTVARLMPLYHFHRGLRRLMVLNSTDGVGVTFAVLGAIAVVALALAVRLTRWRDFGR